MSLGLDLEDAPADFPEEISGRLGLEDTIALKRHVDGTGVCEQLSPEFVFEIFFAVLSPNPQGEPAWSVNFDFACVLGDVASVDRARCLPSR